MRRSVGSGPMPQDDKAAAPALVAPRTFRNRRRSRESVTLVVAHAAVAGYRRLLRHVAADAPAHAQRRDLRDLRHLLDLAVTREARLGAERFDVTRSKRWRRRSEEHTS